ncbi:hypothetical protein GNI_032980 [Gregarina niphandrodes]|uniref:Uncharacterized protein n=1 Tax=Gregarina niphandrodes TaxID=110365 RepID=A0A023BB34_GRENI|nr:hypothetical protein GNI_032980 [Gregarina niphandrodes]EZG78722.1 hypothetical protein GNI_032980 [Gregarina niphandrodes]|eukprot:XP_011129206.1 hypothetical protein GNI_032980 [Gregarina niphandrodes]
MEYEHSSGVEAVAALLNQVVHQDSDSEDGTPTFPWPSWLVDAFKANENSPSSLDGSSEQPNGRLSPSSPAFILPSFKKTTTGYLRMFGVYGDSDEDETGPPLRKESRTEVIHQHVIGQEEDIDHHVIGHDDDDEKVDKLQGLKKNPSFGLSGLLKKIAVHVSNLYGGDEDPDMRTKTAIDEFFQEFRTILESTNYGEELEEYGWTALRIRVEVLERVMEEYKQLLIGKIKKMEQGRDTSVSLKDQEAAAFLYSRFTKMSESDKLYVPGRIIQIIPIEHFVGSDPLWSVGPTTQSKSPSSPTLSSYRTNTAVHPIANDCPPDASIKAQMWCLLSQPGATLPSQVFIDATGCRLDWFEPVFFPSSIEDHSPASYSKGLAPDA